MAESLDRKKKIAEEVAIMELNAEVNSPLSGWGLNISGAAHREHGDLEKAKADFEKALQANPKNEWAKKQLEELKSSK